jgi:hypothetical protein
MDHSEAPDGGSGFVRSVIKAFTGSRFTTPKEPPRASPILDLLLDAERSGRVNANEMAPDEEVKGEIDVGMDSRSPIASLTSELRQERRLTFRGEIGRLESVPRPVSEEKLNLSEKESRSIFGRPDGVPGRSRSRLSPTIDRLDVVGNQNYDALFDASTLAERGVQGGERDLGRGYSEPVPPFSIAHGGDRDLNGEYSRTFPSSFLQRTEERSPAGTAGFREQDFVPRQFTSAPIESAYKWLPWRGTVYTVP